MHEPLRSTARRLLSQYRIRHPQPAENLDDCEERAIEQTIAERLADDRALWFDLTLTASDAAFLGSMRIDPYV